MLLEGFIGLVLLHTAQTGRGSVYCPQNCLNCDTGTCNGCKSGYSGPMCSECVYNCASWRCSPICPLGCRSGWYELGCNARCPRECDGDPCDQHFGTCYKPRGDSGHCRDKKCKVDCEYYCENGVVPDEDIETRETYYEKYPLTTEQIILTIVAIGMVMTCCCCCLARYRRPNQETSRPEQEQIDVLPAKQRLIPGQQAISFASSNAGHNHATYANAFIGSDNVLVYSRIGLQVSNQDGATSQNATTEAPPPPYAHVPVENEDPPPSYDSVVSKADVMVHSNS